MVALTTPALDVSFRAIDFTLAGTDGRMHSLESIRGKNGTVVMFICNHCPYVKAVIDNIVRDMRDLVMHGVGSVAIMSNDPTLYSEDSFENMKRLANEKQFPFPYLMDETQMVAKAYGAVCTPDFFGFDGNMQLKYRGRLDDAGREHKPNSTRELFNAMVQIAETGQAPEKQIPSIGCSIKWRDVA